MNKKVFAFDIDGTLLNKQEIIQETHIEAIKKAKEKGHEVILCSGRGHHDMFHILSQLPEGLFRYLVCNNGSYIHDLKEDKHITNKIMPSIIKQYEEIGKKHKLLYSINTLDIVRRGVMWDKNNEPEWFQRVNIKEWHKFALMPFEKAVEISSNETITQFGFRATKDIIKIVLEDCKVLKGVSLFISGEVYVDILPEGTNKLEGLKNISKILNVPIEDFIAFGDSGNDLEMLSGAGLGIALSNGTDEAKEAADIVIGDNDTSALADKILELI